MKRLLLPLLAALALPTAVNAETWYLLGSFRGVKFWSVPMPSKEQCESEGKRFLNKDNWKVDKMYYPSYICIKGK